MTQPAFDDRLSLIGMRFEARHGVLAEEKERAQPFEVDVVLHADLADAAVRDKLAATVDYAMLHERVARLVTGPSFDLIEALAGAIATDLLGATDPRMVGAVEVRVRKPEAPLTWPLDTVEVALVRRRPRARADEPA